MKMIDDVIIIGIDSGYGNIKTANCCFPASASAYDKEPVFKENLLVYESKFYLIGEGHKEFLADKPRDLDYYVLALAAIARELNIRKMTCGKIRIAAGLPLTWVSGQRDEFREYLLQNKAVDFSFRNVSYHVEIVGVDVFPQGFAAVADRLSDFRGVNMICDIGNGTMNIMFINDKKPVSGNMFTEKYGTHQCLLAVRENVMRAHHTTVDEAIINRVFRFGTADIKEDYLKTISLDFEVTPHQLRHTYITNLIYASVDPKTVQYLAGHENSKITMDIYAKAKYNRPKDVAPMLEHVFNQWNETTK